MCFFIIVLQKSLCKKLSVLRGFHLTATELRSYPTKAYITLRLQLRSTSHLVPEKTYILVSTVYLKKNKSQYNLTAQIEQMQDEKNYSIMSRHYRNQMRGTAQLQPQCDVSFRWVRT
jgi:hypothetical protein